MGNPQCRWVRDRLPLLAGDDLLGSERRRVERHLIGCPTCRRREESLGSALGALRRAAEVSPVPGDAPTLWPAVARQIRESRRPARSWGLPLPWDLAWSRLRPWPTFGLGLALLAALGLTAAVRHQAAASRARIALDARPVAPPAPGPVAPELPQAPAPVVSQAEPAPAEAPSASRYDYDLEHGTPMGPEVVETRSKLTH